MRWHRFPHYSSLRYPAGRLSSGWLGDQFFHAGDFPLNMHPLSHLFRFSIYVAGCCRECFNFCLIRSWMVPCTMIRQSGREPCWQLPSSLSGRTEQWVLTLLILPGRGNGTGTVSEDMPEDNLELVQPGMNIPPSVIRWGVEF